MCDCLIRLRNYDEARKMFEKMPLSEKPGNRRNAKRFYLEGMLNVVQDRDSAADSLFVKLFKSSPESPMNQSAQNLAVLHIVKSQR